MTPPTPPNTGAILYVQGKQQQHNNKIQQQISNNSKQHNNNINDNNMDNNNVTTTMWTTITLSTSLYTTSTWLHQCDFNNMNNNNVPQLNNNYSPSFRPCLGYFELFCFISQIFYLSTVNVYWQNTTKYFKPLIPTSRLTTENGMA